MSIGLTEDEFWHSNMRKLKPYDKAQMLRDQRADFEAWNQGRYMVRAVVVALDSAFNGSKARATYFEKPLLSDNENEELTQMEYEEKVMREQIAQMDALIAREKIMGMP